MDNRNDERLLMIETQLRPRGITDEKVLEAFRNIPRHFFVPEEYEKEAYGDYPIKIGEGQTISQPYMVAEMTQLLQIQPGNKILEIGTGSGYQAALLARMGAEVYTIERKTNLIKIAEMTLKKAGINDIQLKAGDGTLGWPEYAPYDGIVVTAAAPYAPAPLLDQLAESGRLVIPVGSRLTQVLKVYRKNGSSIEEADHGGCMFVPLIGENGWPK
ncbi:protein-L-isoaspartate(D-aspartate) O-methyltransferase [Elusimicrobiota bacterium]